LLAVPYVNLYDAFAAASPDSLYFRGGDNHWNEKGQALAAESTLEALEQQGVLQRATAR
jgi:hypothetical protein